jgi:uroporphyrinogen-III synthase
MTRPDRHLEGITVLVTRPTGQGEGLCREIEAAGGRAASFPLLVIRPVDDAALRQRLQDAVASSAAIIFISRNAAEIALRMLPEPAAFAGRTVIAAGPATREALIKGGVENVIGTDSTRASEALLDRPELDGGRIGSAGVAIIRGEGGRELLAEELTRRGARVKVVEIYRREAPSPTPEQVHALWREVRPDIVVITSATALYNLVAITADDDRPLLFGTRLAVMSERIGDIAAELGFSKPPLVAAAPSDSGLVRAIAKGAELIQYDR